jgi:hypothetical protein
MCGEVSDIANCSCRPGQRQCRNGALVECVQDGKCLELIERCDCIYTIDDGTGECAKGPEQCDRIRQLYAERTAHWGARPAREVTSTGPQAYNCDPGRGCGVRMSRAHCEAGLSDCWYLEPRPMSEDPELERLYTIYVRLGCAANATCRCPQPPTQLACLEGNPVWPNPGGSGSTHACVTGPPPAADGGKK